MNSKKKHIKIHLYIMYFLQTLYNWSYIIYQKNRVTDMGQNILSVHFEATGYKFVSLDLYSQCVQ